MAKAIKTVNLYGEDGIAVYLNGDQDICNDVPSEAVVKVVGRAIYACSIEDAEKSIRRAYLQQAGIADPLALGWA